MKKLKHREDEIRMLKTQITDQTDIKDELTQAKQRLKSKAQQFLEL